MRRKGGNHPKGRAGQLYQERPWYCLLRRDSGKIILPPEMRQISPVFKAVSALGWWSYQLILGAVLAISAPWVLARRGRHYLQTLLPRLGFPEKGEREVAVPRTGTLWIHAVSVGEVSVAETLTKGLPEAIPLVVSTITPTGQERARKVFRGRASVAYFPFELGFAVRRWFSRFRPEALILVEGDLWPLVLRGARRRGVPIVVVNGRISDRSFPRLRRLRRWLGPLLGPVDFFAMQTTVDRDRLVALGVGADRVAVTGNLKFETALPDRLPALEAAFEALAGDRPILIAGSTMAGEEELVLEAFRRLLDDGTKALLMLVPRHPERWGDVYRLAVARGFAVAKRSEFDQEPAARETEVVLLDSLGELAALYRLAASAFIGGTLVAKGGHNPLESARFGVPTVVGPSMENFREMAGHFDAASAWSRVDSAGSLASTWGRWLDHPGEAAEVGRRGARLIESHRGALEATLAALQPILRSLPGRE